MRSNDGFRDNLRQRAKRAMNVRSAVALIAITGTASGANAAAAAVDFTAVVSSGWPGVSPQLIAECAEVWTVLARPDNPVWPGRDAGTIRIALRPTAADATH